MVTFNTREYAEKAIDEFYGKLVINVQKFYVEYHARNKLVKISR